MTPLPIPVHVGSEPPASWDDIEARQREHGEDASRWLREKRRPPIASATLEWNALGFEPRWVGFDTADCAAALAPSVYSGHGADEFNRFRQRAESRGELALVISPVGRQRDGGGFRNVLSQHDDSIHLGCIQSSISSKPLGIGAKVRSAPDLGDADSQLALRLLSCNPTLSWRSLSLHGVTYEAYNGRVHHPAQGILEPIVETDLGEPVVAAWISPDGVERRYVVPAEAPWRVVLQWLLEQALPEFLPDALRRARRPLASDQALMTRRERAAGAAMTELESEYATRRTDLEREFEDAEVAGSAVRDGLLYGTGKQLVDAVRMVLEAADVNVVDLDDYLGGTKNADLLCTYGDRSRLVEVKSASGNAPERAYEDLVRHLRGWRSLQGNTPVEGGALVLNHQHRSVPHERSPKPYSRPEFLAAQAEPVITTLDLFEAWREEDLKTIRRLLFGDATKPMVDPSTVPTGDPESKGRRRRWLRR
jgi:hypothetical protein